MANFVNKPEEKEKNIKFLIPLNEEQKLAKTQILENDIVYLTGKSGSGKTLLACQVALDLLFKNKVKKIVITRSVVTAGENIGYLPGDLSEKLDPFLQAIYKNFHILYRKEYIDKLIKDEKIEIIPLAFMRGRTLLDCVTIVDEAQNMTVMQTKMVLERIGINSKILLCGDKDQVDLPKNIESGVGFLDFLESTQLKGFKKIELFENHRHELVEGILKSYEEFKK